MADELSPLPVVLPRAPRGRRWPPLSPLTPLLALVNRLIESEPWARDLLLPFAGKVAHLELRPVLISIEITPAGLLKQAEPAAIPALVMRLPAAQLAALMISPGRAKNLIEIEGDTEFAEALGKLIEHLRPDLEEGLSKIFGDVLAVRIVAGMNAVRHDLKEAGVRFADNVSEYLLEETDTLIRPNEVEVLSARVRVLRDDLARLEKRVDRLDMES